MAQLLANTTIGGKSILDLTYPVGAIYMSTSNASPSVLFGGTWVAWEGGGRVPVGINTNDSDFNTVEKTGGKKTHTLTIDEMPVHSHPLDLTAHGYSGWGSQKVNAYTLAFPYNSSYNHYFASNTTLNMAGVSAGPHAYARTVGSGQAFSIMPPHMNVYDWKRTK